MTKFGQLKALKITDEVTAEYTLYDIENQDGSSPVLILSPAGELNKAYFNALLRRSRKNMPQIQAQKFDTGLIESNRSNDRVLYSKHIVKGWKKVQDEKGKDVIFNEENCLGFLEALPNWIFDGARNFATKERNFIKEDSPNVEETAGNSPTG